MISYLARRVATALLTVFVVVSLSFFMIRLMPGNVMDYLVNQLSRQGNLTTQEIQQQVNAIYGVMPTSPAWKQYFQYIWHVCQGNFGTSISHPGESVSHIIASALPWTVFSVGVALIVSFVIGIAVGTVMAAAQASRFTKVVTLVVSFLSAVPNYLVAILLLYFLTEIHHLFPQGGAYGAGIPVGWNLPFVASVVRHSALPIASYALIGFGGWALQMKGSAISTLGAEYVRVAEARGLGRRRIMQSYVGRNSLLPQVTLLALSLGFMFGGSVFIEQFFNYPGVGYYLVTAVNSRDYSLMMGCFVLITTSVVFSNLLVDLMYPVIDPRIAKPGAGRKAGTEDPRDVEERAVPVGGTMA
ncbi:ABC transporter permease subunit [Actinopolymorpha rutila]|uniref:Peptide/nickel transport system permease protein n=1 Tax=Actinopolymorpha rutila TaxID=446787 RepID=A0A852ZDL5_9ACTN|nr:peptide/nickel transport system permease protein [Actinopolymorpha rutila]